MLPEPSTRRVQFDVRQQVGARDNLAVAVRRGSSHDHFQGLTRRVAP